MAESMDFSDMFRKTDAEPGRSFPTKPRLTSTGTRRQATVEASENVPPTNHESVCGLNEADKDSMTYVRNSLRDLGHDIQAKDLSQPALKAIEMLFKERCYWQNQTTAVSEECVKLKSQQAQNQRDKSHEHDAMEVLKRDNQQLLARISALTLEHRDMRNHWVTEKSDLQSRIFQIQALNTQISGTLKKKEKDFEKLQNQLAKIVKDANKAQAKPAIVMSLPVRKNLSQGVGEQGSAASILKDSEMQSAKKTIVMLDAENQTLRGTVETLQQSLEELHETFEHAVQQSEAKTREQLEMLLDQHNAALASKAEEVAALQQQVASLTREQELQRIKAAAVENVPAVAETVVVASPPPVTAPPAQAAQQPATPAATKLHVDFKSPSQLRSTVKFRVAATPGSIAKRYLEGTPGARPVQWVVEQANTEVKRLRARAEEIARGDAGAAALTALDGYAAWSELHGGADAASAGAQALWRMKLHSMKLRLSEAMVVIQEQDRLIHSALVGRPVGMDENFVLSAASFAEGEVGNAEGHSQAAIGVDNEHIAAKAEILNHAENMSTLQDSDFLPPASPATWALLQSFGWSCLPNKAVPEDVAQGVEEAAAAKATLAGEFDAEDC